MGVGGWWGGGRGERGLPADSATMDFLKNDVQIYHACPSLFTLLVK